MPNRLFRLMERYQKMDDALQLAQSRQQRSLFEILRLKRIKLALSERIGRMLQQQMVLATVH